MSKIVARMEKMKIGNLGGIQRHNQRETDNHSNKDIDIERSHLNYDLVNNEPINYREKVMDLIDSQRVSTRAIRKDAVLVDEWIITSDKQFFETADSKKFFQDSLDYFSERCGNQNIAYATVHLDETTPHMHLGIVPMKEGRLSHKLVFNRQSLRDVQDELPKYLQEQGHEIERGIKGSEQKHLTVAEYKENKLAVKLMEKEVIDKKRELKVTEMDLISKEKAFTDELCDTWEQEWQVTKEQFSDFSMTYTVNSLTSLEPEKIIVDEHTPREFRLNFREVMDLFKEKYTQLKTYVADKWQELTNKEDMLENKRNYLKERESALETKLEGINSEIGIKEQKFDLLNDLVDKQTRYLDQLTNSAELSMALPEYVKPSRMNKDMLIVPKEKWLEKHVSANEVNDMLKIKDVFTGMKSKIERIEQKEFENYDNVVELNKLKLENSTLKLENQQFSYSFEALIDAKIIDSEVVKLLELPDYLKPQQQVSNDMDLNQSFDGPTLSL